MRDDKRSVSRITDRGGPLLIWEDDIKSFHYKKGFLLDVYVCDNTKCPYIHFRAFDIDERFKDIGLCGEGLSYKINKKEDKESLPTAKLSGNIHYDTGKVAVTTEDGFHKESSDLLSRIIAQLADTALMDLLRKRWRDGKKVDRDAWKKKDWSWWEPGEMVSWFDVFSDEPDLVVKEGNQSVIADSMHCITPGCRCKDILYSFTTIDKPTKNIGAITIDLSKWTTGEILTQTNNHQRVRELWKQLNDQYPDLRMMTNKRQEEMKKICKELVRLSGKLPIDQNVSGVNKVSRNEPCPCGSGKKYKKCCMK